MGSSPSPKAIKAGDAKNRSQVVAHTGKRRGAQGLLIALLGLLPLQTSCSLLFSPSEDIPRGDGNTDTPDAALGESDADMSLRLRLDFEGNLQDSSDWGHSVLTNGAPRYGEFRNGVHGSFLLTTDDNLLSISASSDPSENSGLAIDGNFSAMAWIRSNDPSYGYVVAKDLQYKIRMRTGGLNCGMYRAGDGEQELTVGVNNSDNAWHHAACVLEDDAIVAYWDGCEVGRYPTDSKLMNNVEYDVHIGSEDGDSDFFRGAIDLVQIWSRALSASEIAEQGFREEPCF